MEIEMDREDFLVDLLALGVGKGQVNECCESVGSIPWEFKLHRATLVDAAAQLRPIAGPAHFRNLGPGANRGRIDR
jgi:hypothetical protein